jgi:hypothetical protein
MILHLFIELSKGLQDQLYIKILDRSEINNGDHNPLKLSPDCKTIINEMKTQFKEPNWLDPFQREAYKSIVKKNVVKLEAMLAEHKACNDACTKKLLATQIFKELSSTLTRATTVTIEFTKIKKIKVI